jgi:hypothetical protein
MSAVFKGYVGAVCFNKNFEVTRQYDLTLDEDFPFSTVGCSYLGILTYVANWKIRNAAGEDIATDTFHSDNRFGASGNYIYSLIEQ